MCSSGDLILLSVVSRSFCHPITFAQFQAGAILDSVGRRERGLRLGCSHPGFFGLDKRQRVFTSLVSDCCNSFVFFVKTSLTCSCQSLMGCVLLLNGDWEFEFLCSLGKEKKFNRFVLLLNGRPNLFILTNFVCNVKVVGHI